MNAHVLGPLSPSDSPVILTLYREVSAGFPSPAESFSEARLSIDDLVRLRQPSMFLVRAKGDSMINAGIYPEDVLIVDKARQAKSGDTVIARIGSEFTVKTLHIGNDGRVMLVPENDAYSPIVLGDGEELEIWGVCTWNLHQLGSCA